MATTRWLLGIGGGALAVQGLRQRTLAGSMLAGLGCGLAWWAIAGEGDLTDAQQLVAAGWSRIAGTTSGPIALSTWKLPGDGDWRGLLLVNELAGETRSLLVQAQLVQ